MAFLHNAGFETTDSGDGVTKPADERSVEGPHVFMTAAPCDAVGVADRLRRELHRRGVTVQPLGPDGLGVSIQLMYDPCDQSAVIMLCGLDDAGMPNP